jgi:hypothetical protein
VERDETSARQAELTQSPIFFESKTEKLVWGFVFPMVYQSDSIAEFFPALCLSPLSVT